MPVKRERQCLECKQRFADPESLRKHRYSFGGCRSVESLSAVGFKLTDKGWVAPPVVANSNR
jgi:hypothetical protein